MKLRMKSKPFVLTLILAAVVSTLAIGSLVAMDRLITGVLYDFGLRFSYRWALPYWTYSAAIFGLSWFNIAASIGLIYYVYRGRVRPDSLVDNKMMVAEAGEQLVLGEYTEAPVDLAASPAEGFDGEPDDGVVIGLVRYDVTQPAYIVDSQC